MRYYSSKGEEVNLGEILGSGGEGKIFAIKDNTNMVAKIYKGQAGEEKSAKLSTMVKLQSPRLSSISAWPVDTLHSEKAEPVVGFVMKKVLGKSIHLLYSPKSRIVEFPNAGWDFILHAAINLARAFGVVHECGHVVGDVNHDNAYIQKDATVILIDCDSFQINGYEHKYLCEVGVMTHQPPEFQNISSFRRVVREANHDNFGLAVLIFQLLFLGRHPFSGRYLGEGEMPIERAILEGRFAYGSSAKSRLMEQPPNALSINVVPQELFQLFERAFTHKQRPRPQEWILSLDKLRLKLKACSNPFHKYYECLSSCPICEVEAKTGTVLFNYTGIITGSQRMFNIFAILKEINSVEEPSKLPLIPSKTSVKACPTKEYLIISKKRTIKKIISISISVVGIAGVLLSGLETTGAIPLIATVLTTSGGIAFSGRSEYRKLYQRARTAFNAAKVDLDRYINQWNRAASDKRFNDRKFELNKLADEYNELTIKGQKMVKAAELEIRKYQLQKFLDSFRIYDAKIDKISHTKKATLQSYGIETAADIDPRYLAVIPGFGPKYTNNLLEWRRKIESRFVFNPNKGVDRFQLSDIHKKINEEKMKIENELSRGAVELKHIAEETNAIRNELMIKIDKALQDYAQAEANLKC